MRKDLKAKGRANSALRIGLRTAQQEFEEQGDSNAAADCRRALERADRLERDDA